MARRQLRAFREGGIQVKKATGADIDDERTGFKGIGKRIESAESQGVEIDNREPQEPTKKNETNYIKKESDVRLPSAQKPIGKKLLIALGIIVLIVYLASKQEEPSRSSSPAVQNPPRTVPQSSPSAPSRSYKNERLRDLKSIIETNKDRLSSMESELKGLEYEIANLGRQLDRLKSEIKQREDLNMDNYDLVSEHNRYVPVFNAKLQEFNNSLAEYRRLLNETNAMVSEHNEIIRR